MSLTSTKVKGLKMAGSMLSLYAQEARNNPKHVSLATREAFYRSDSKWQQSAKYNESLKVSG